MNVLRQQIEDLENNQLTETPTIATSYHFVDSAKARFRKFLPEGHSEQDGEPTPENPVDVKSCGENVNEFNPDRTNVTAIANCTVTVDEDGTYRVNTTGINAYFNEVENVGTEHLERRGLLQEVKSSTQYTFNTGNSVFNDIYITEYDSNNISLGYTRYTNSSFTFTTKANTKYIVPRIGSQNAESGKEYIVKSKLEKGTKATPYSPYGMGCVNEKVSNKNWFDKNKLIRGGSTNPFLTNAVVCNCFKITVGDKLVVSRYNSNYLYAFVITDSPIQSTSANVLYSSGYLSSNSWYYTSPFSGYGYLQIKKAADGSIIPSEINSNDFQVEKGTLTATSYVEHEEQNIIIPTQQPFRSIGTVRDKFVKVNGTWYERHYILEEKITTEKISYHSVAQGIYQFKITPSNIYKYVSTQITMLSNYFYGYTGTDWWQKNNVITISSAGNIFIATGDFTNETEIDDFVTNNDMKIVGLLTTPLDLPCTPEQIQQLENRPSTYKTETNVNSEDEIEAYIDAEYVIDLKTYIDNN